jgi:hypothetical protein
MQHCRGKTMSECEGFDVDCTDNYVVSRRTEIVGTSQRDKTAGFCDRFR